MSREKTTARLPGTVQGVVVQIRTSAPVERLRPRDHRKFNPDGVEVWS